VARQIRLSISSSVGNLERSNRIQNLFGQQVSREIADEMVKSNGTVQSRKIKVCIMFIDIRNFSLYAEGRNPEEVVQYQQSFFSTVIEVMQKHAGIINQFLGDGCMITFGAPVELRNPCGNAVNAALELRDEIRKKVTGNRIPPIKFGTGIHYGEAVTGNIGTELRQQYTVTGEVVILAARIEQLNKEFGSEILVSKEVLEFIPENRNLFRNLGIVKVKGKDDGIEIFSATT
jgi:adenylate cyclase